MKRFLALNDFNLQELREYIDRALALKQNRGAESGALRGKTLALLFLKSSTRTRVSFEAAMIQLGGGSIYLNPDTTQISRGETIADTVRTLSRYVDALAVRLYEHDMLLEMADNASIPVINGLTNFNHPCQILSDLMTIYEHTGRLEGVRTAFLGPANNNLVHSMLHAFPQFGAHLTVCSPEGESPDPSALQFAQQTARQTDAQILLTHDPSAAVQNADIVYTDVWFSMHEKPTPERQKAYEPYQVNADLMRKAPDGALFMHCLPAHRGHEVTDEVADSDQSIIFDQAENRLHLQKAVLLDMMGT